VAGVETQEARHGRAPFAGPARAVKPEAPRTWFPRDWSVAVLLIAAIFIACQPVWRPGFIWDDDVHLTANPAMQNRLAWALATAAQTSLRDGAKAVQFAAQASQATDANNADILRTLAAAYAQEGQYPEAVETAQKALGLAQTASDTALEGALCREIKLYQAGQPYSEPPSR